MSTATLVTPVEVSGLSPEHRAVLDDILRDLQSSVDRLARAARRWAELPEKVRARIVEQTNPSFRDFWRKLEAVGAGTLHPQLATVGGTAARLLGRLPLEDQGRYLAERIPVVVQRGRGWDVRLVDVAEMSDDQRKQVFKLSADRSVSVRGEEAQKQWLADRAAKRLVEKQAAESLRRVERSGWVVEGGRAWIKPAAAEAGLTLRQVQRLLGDLEGG